MFALTLLKLQKVAQDPGNDVVGEVAVGDPIDLKHRRQRTSAKTGHLLNGKHSFRVCIIVFGNFQMLTDGVINWDGAFDVAGGSIAEAYHVTSHRAVSELGVKRPNTHYLRRRDVRYLTYSLQSLFREIPIVLLKLLEYGDHKFRSPAKLFNDLVDV